MGVGEEGWVGRRGRKVKGEWEWVMGGGRRVEGFGDERGFGLGVKGGLNYASAQ